MLPIRPKKRFFISLLDAVREELDVLAREGQCTFFLDEKDNWDKDYFDGPIRGELSRATAGLVMATRRAMNSKWVHHEAAVLYWRRLHNPYFHLFFIVAPSSIKPEWALQFSAVDAQNANTFDVVVPREIGSVADLERHLGEQELKDKIRQRVRTWVESCGRSLELDSRVQFIRALIQPLPGDGLLIFVNKLRKLDNQDQGDEVVDDHEARALAAHMLAEAELTERVGHALLAWHQMAPGHSEIFVSLIRVMAERVAPPMIAIRLRECLELGDMSIARIRTTDEMFIDYYLNAALGPTSGRLPQKRYRIDKPQRPTLKRIGQIGRGGGLPGEIAKLLREQPPWDNDRVILIIIEDFRMSDDDVHKVISDSLSVLGIDLRKVSVLRVLIARNEFHDRMLEGIIDCQGQYVGEGGRPREAYFSEIMKTLISELTRGRNSAYNI